MPGSALKSALIARASMPGSLRRVDRSRPAPAGVVPLAARARVVDRLLRESLAAEPRALEVALDRMIDRLARLERAARRGGR